MNELPSGPFDKDVLEEKRKEKPLEKPLSEENFIHESPTPPIFSGFPLWLWLALLTSAIALVWGSLGWFQGIVQKEIQSKPFLEVSNRKFSVFLWQFPAFMRSYAKQKSGYLPGFQYGDRFTLELETADQFVSAPPELLFLYHTWSRLLSSDYIARPIPPLEFAEFLDQAQEWQPQYWKEAPPEYVQLIKSRSYETTPNLQILSEATLPMIVRQAFQGWKNYFKEGDAINKLAPTYEQVKQFLEKHPFYARNYWRNIEFIDDKEVAGTHYLLSLVSGNDLPQQIVPSDQLASFLRFALYNAQQAENSK